MIWVVNRATMLEIPVRLPITRFVASTEPPSRHLSTQQIRFFSPRSVTYVVLHSFVCAFETFNGVDIRSKPGTICLDAFLIAGRALKVLPA